MAVAVGKDFMKKELEQRFYERWPSWFSGRHEPISQNLMAFGFDHGDGWFDLEWRLCEDLEKLVGPGYKLFQIKEKFGTLRWYDSDDIVSDAANAAAHQRIREAEQESARTCERCGKPGTLRQGGWWRTLCNTCVVPK